MLLMVGMLIGVISWTRDYNTTSGLKHYSFINQRLAKLISHIKISFLLFDSFDHHNL